MIKYARGLSMQVSIDSETYDMPGYAIDDTSQYTGKNNVKYVDSASAWDKENNRLTVFVINRNLTDTYDLTLDVRGFEGYTAAKHEEMFSKDFDAVSSFGNDWKAPEKNNGLQIKNGIATTTLKPLSWNVITFERN